MISKEFEQLKIGFGAMTVKSHEFWALLYSSHDNMNIQEHLSYFLISYHISLISACTCRAILVCYNYSLFSDYIK